MFEKDELSAYKHENNELLAIIVEYIQKYGLTEKAREYFERLASQKLDG